MNNNNIRAAIREVVDGYCDNTDLMVDDLVGVVRDAVEAEQRRADSELKEFRDEVYLKHDCPQNGMCPLCAVIHSLDKERKW